MPYERKKKDCRRVFPVLSHHTFLGPQITFELWRFNSTGRCDERFQFRLTLRCQKLTGKRFRAFGQIWLLLLGHPRGTIPETASYRSSTASILRLLLNTRTAVLCRSFFFRSLRKQRNIFQLFKASKNLQPAAIRSKSLPFLWDSLSPDGWTICCVWGRGVSGGRERAINPPYNVRGKRPWWIHAVRV